VELQTLLTNIFFGIFKLSVLMIFTTAMIQTIKGVSAVGFFRIFWEVIRTLLKTKDKDGNLYPVSDETWKTLNFVIALIGLKLLNFTLLSQFLGIDLETLSKGAVWFDYLGTASLTFMGSDWVFRNFESLADAGKKFKNSIVGGP
jgi:hypothetical protein